MSWIKRVYPPFLIVMISCFFGVALVEVALRIINSNNQWSKTDEANILRDYQFLYDVSQLYATDSPSVNYIRNQYGLRDACENPSEIEILTVGGSTTDQRYVSFESTYQTIIEQRLKKSVDNFGCVSNAGIDGHSTWGHLYSFKHWFPLIPELNPKIVLLYVGVNDANFHRATSPNAGFDTKRINGVKDFLRVFEIVKALLPIYRLLRQTYNNSSAAYAGHKPRKYSVDDYKVNVLNEHTELLSEQNAIFFRSRLKSLLDEIHSMGAKPLCVTQPHRYVMEKEGVIWGVENILGYGFSGIDYDHSIRKINDVIFDLCGANTVDLYNHGFSDSHFYDGIHTTASGSEEIGRVIAESIGANLKNE